MTKNALGEEGNHCFKTETAKDNWFNCGQVMRCKTLERDFMKNSFTDVHTVVHEVPG